MRLQGLGVWGSGARGWQLLLGEDSNLTIQRSGALVLTLHVDLLTFCSAVCLRPRFQNDKNGGEGAVLNFLISHSMPVSLHRKFGTTHGFGLRACFALVFKGLQGSGLGITFKKSMIRYFVTSKGDSQIVLSDCLTGNICHNMVVHRGAANMILCPISSTGSTGTKPQRWAC